MCEANYEPYSFASVEWVETENWGSESESPPDARCGNHMVQAIDVGHVSALVGSGASSPNVEANSRPGVAPNIDAVVVPSVAGMADIHRFDSCRCT
jgi:hypothetical protein